jgi:acetyl esterase
LFGGVEALPEGVLMRRFALPAILFGLTAAAGSVAQRPDTLTVRKAINDSCQMTRGTKDAVGKVEGLEITDGGRTIPARLYRPTQTGTLPVLLFFHGGGFVAGNLDTHDNACRYLCQRTPCLALAVDYRLAPEHKFPAQPEDCFAAAAWAAKNAARLGGDPDRLAVVGDSGGGTLAAAVCQLARDRKGPRLRAQVLVNPALDLAGWDKKGLESSRLFRDFYLKEPKDGATAPASPLLADDFRGLPPAFVVVGEKDSLRAEGEAYVAKLRGAGVPANAYCQYGQSHLAHRWVAASPVAEEALDLPIGFLRAALRPSE